MPSEQQSYFISGYLPPYTTTVTYYDLALETRASSASTAGQRASKVFTLTDSRVMATDCSLALPMSTSTATNSEALSQSPPASAFPASETASTRSSAGTPGKRPSRAVTIAVPLSLILILAICGFAILFVRRRINQRKKDCARRTSGSSFRNDYNAPPLFPRKPLGRMSDTSFNSTATASSTTSMKNQKPGAQQATAIRELHSSPPNTP